MVLKGQRSILQMLLSFTPESQWQQSNIKVILPGRVLCHPLGDPEVFPNIPAVTPTANNQEKIDPLWSGASVLTSVQAGQLPKTGGQV